MYCAIVVVLSTAENAFGGPIFSNKTLDESDEPNNRQTETNHQADRLQNGAAFHHIVVAIVVVLSSSHRHKPRGRYHPGNSRQERGGHVDPNQSFEIGNHRSDHQGKQKRR